jgi:predicted Zn-dependent protease
MEVGMEFVLLRELSKSPKAAFDKLGSDGKAVIPNNGRPNFLRHTSKLPYQDPAVMGMRQNQTFHSI